MGEASRRRSALQEIVEREVTDAETGLTYHVRSAGITPRQYLDELRRAAINQDELKVPCKGCTACCWWPRVEVYPEREKPEDLQHLAIAEDGDGWHLQKREDGACIHLGASGCSVHEHRPRACRLFDCRILGLSGGLFPIDKRHIAPFWVFPNDHPDDQAILMAAGMGIAPLVAAKSQPEWGNSVDAILKGIRDYLPAARKVIAEIRKLPKAELEKLKKAGDEAWKALRALQSKPPAECEPLL